MTDMIELASEIVRASAGAPVRFRQGVIQSVNADGTCSVTVAGSTTVLTNVKVAAHACPVPNSTVFLATDGADWFVLASIAPNGHAWGAMRQSSAQSIPNNTWTAMSWANRTDTASYGVTLGNSGLTCVVPGLYQITGAAAFASNATGQRHMVLTVNAANAIHGTGGNAAAGSDVSRVRADGLYRLAIGDVVNFELFQSSGAALNTQTGAGHSMLRMVWISPAP